MLVNLWWREGEVIQIKHFSNCNIEYKEYVTWH